MRKVSRSIACALCACTSTAVYGADFNTPSAASSAWELAFGSALMSDYNFRGITASAHRPSIEAYFEPEYNISTALQLYAGLNAASIAAPNRAAAQIVYYGGARTSINAFSFDLGLSYIDYPGGILFDGLGSPATCTNGAFYLGQCNTSKAVASYLEYYFRSTFAINEALCVSTNLYYASSWVNSGAPGTYLSFVPKATLPTSLLPEEINAWLSGEIGHYWFGTTDTFYAMPAFPAGVRLPSYTTWNIGIGIAYKSIALDLRYYDTDLSRANCNVLTGDFTATFGGPSAVTPTNSSGLVSNWCGAAFVAKLSFDTTVANLH